MTFKATYTLLIIVIACLSIVGLASTNQRTAINSSTTNTSATPVWEYKIVEVGQYPKPSDMAITLASLGQEGWELVSVESVKYHNASQEQDIEEFKSSRCYLKRKR